jgi:hypothetical protein
VEPESEEMKTKVLMVIGVEGPQVGEIGVPCAGAGVEREIRFWAVTRGPIAFVLRWWAKVWNELGVLVGLVGRGITRQVTS